MTPVQVAAPQLTPHALQVQQQQFLQQQQQALQQQQQQAQPGVGVAAQLMYARQMTGQMMQNGQQQYVVATPAGQPMPLQQQQPQQAAAPAAIATSTANHPVVGVATRISITQPDPPTSQQTQQPIAQDLQQQQFQQAAQVRDESSMLLPFI